MARPVLKVGTPEMVVEIGLNYLMNKEEKGLLNVVINIEEIQEDIYVIYVKEYLKNNMFKKQTCIMCYGTGKVFRCLMRQKCITCDGLGYKLYPQNNTQDTPKPLESGHNSSYTEGEKA